MYRNGYDSNLWPSKSRSRSWATMVIKWWIYVILFSTDLLKRHTNTHTNTHTHTHTHEHTHTHTPTIEIGENATCCISPKKMLKKKILQLFQGYFYHVYRPGSNGSVKGASSFDHDKDIVMEFKPTTISWGHRFPRYHVHVEMAIA